MITFLDQTTSGRHSRFRSSGHCWVRGAVSVSRSSKHLLRNGLAAIGTGLLYVRYRLIGGRMFHRIRERCPAGRECAYGAKLLIHLQRPFVPMQTVAYLEDEERSCSVVKTRPF